jgi:hypothetical protein
MTDVFFLLASTHHGGKCGECNFGLSESSWNHCLAGVQHTESLHVCPFEGTDEFITLMQGRSMQMRVIYFFRASLFASSVRCSPFHGFWIPSLLSPPPPFFHTLLFLLPFYVAISTSALLVVSPPPPWLFQHVLNIFWLTVTRKGYDLRPYPKQLVIS